MAYPGPPAGGMLFGVSGLLLFPPLSLVGAGGNKLFLFAEIGFA